MTTVTLTLDDELAARLHARAKSWGMDANRYAVAVLADVLAREQNNDAPDPATPPLSSQKITPLSPEERHHALYGPGHSLEESSRRLREKYNVPDYSHLTEEELAEQSMRTIAAMTPEQRAELEREGLL